MNVTLETVTEKESGIACQMAIHSRGTPGKPVVLCVHGLTRNAQDFYPLAQHLADDYHVIMLDIPGRGQSPNLPHPALYNNVFYAAIVAEWLAQQSFETVHYIGTSMGGIIGMIIAATRPKLIHSLLLNDVGSMIPAIAIDRIKAYVGVGTEDDDYEVLATRATENLAPFGIQTPAILETFIASSITERVGGGYRFTYDAAIRDGFLEIPAGDVDMLELWQAIHHPTLIIRGEHSDLLTQKTAQDMVASRENAQLFEVKNAGHAPSLTRAEEIEHIKWWLNSA